jgi:sterol desaturase/sphingolipid hydroxylase (fatty acid hydroxylase superfamily)
MSAKESARSNDKSPFSWHPELPISNSPLFDRPLRPLSAANFHLGRGFLWSATNLLYVAMAIATWLFFGPRLERCVEFEAGWIAQIYAINLVSTLLLAGGLHLYFYTFKRQGMERRIDPSEHGRDNPKFFGRAQVWDNMFYTCVSGVTIWTAYVVLFMWLYANNLIPWLTWGTSVLGMVWFVLLFPLLVVFESAHFYFVHRLLHIKQLWRWHAHHHRNVNIGPWSGFSMHPVEHVLYFSNILIHLIVISHPVHMLYNMYFTALAAVTSHTGYSSLLVKDRAVVDLGNFHHQLHHRYFDCNYGTQVMPWDKWFGSFHDGTAEATRRVREYQRKKRGGARVSTAAQQ